MTIHPEGETIFSRRYTYTSTSTIYNSCYQVEVADIIATPLANVLSCDAYILAGNFYGKKRRKRSEVLNDEIRETSDKISPSKVTSVDVLIIYCLLPCSP